MAQPTIEALPVATLEGILPVGAALGSDVPVSPAEDWRAAARAVLVDRRGAVVRLDQLLLPETVPRWRCVEPWTKLEFGTSLVLTGFPLLRTVGPCCVDYQVSPQR